MPLTLVRHLKDLVTHEAWDGTTTGRNVRGYLAAKQVRAKVEPHVAQVSDHKGNTVTSSCVCYLRNAYTDGTPVAAIGPYDRITLPAGNVPQQPPIINAHRETHDAGIYGWRVVL